MRKYEGKQDLIWGGDKENCEHRWGGELVGISGRNDSGEQRPNFHGQSSGYGGDRKVSQGNFCSLCGAWKGQLGLEPNPSMYINHIVEIFQEVKRVLRKDGVCFVNCGDSYFGGGVPRGGQSGKRGKVLSNLTSDDDSLRNLCDGCVMKSALRNLDNKSYLSAIPVSSNGQSNRSHKEQSLDHSESLRSASRGDHSGDETLGLYSVPNSADVVVPDAQESIGLASSGVSLRYPLAPACWCYLTDALPFAVAIPENGDKMVCPYAVGFASAEARDLYSHKQDTALTGGASASRKMGKVYDYSVPYPYYNIQPHLKAKDLCLIPQRLAIAFQDAGWWVRSVIIWNKLNPMPESIGGWRWEKHRVKIKNSKRDPNKSNVQGDSRHKPESSAKWIDCPGCEKCLPNDGLVLRKGSWRPTNSYEFILMLTKSGDYFADADAVKEPNKPDHWRQINPERQGVSDMSPKRQSKDYSSQSVQSMAYDGIINNPQGRNLRDVWTFPTTPFPGAHFAVFPEKLPELCIKAATSEKGCCPKCGAPWTRIITRKPINKSWWAKQGRTVEDVKDIGKYGGKQQDGTDFKRKDYDIRLGPAVETETLGWRPTCNCGLDNPIPCTILDPFMGSGTTLLVATKLGRKSIGYDISDNYCKMAVNRCRQQPFSLT